MSGEGMDREPYDGPERRQGRPMQLTDEQIEQIAEKAAEKAVDKITKEAYAAVGKSVVSKFTWAVGVIAVALYLWLSKVGFIDGPKP